SRLHQSFHLHDVKWIFRYLKGQPKMGLRRLISWQCKKETIVATSTTKAKGGDSLVRAATTASLDAQQDSSNIAKTQSKATPNELNRQGEGSGSGPGCQETMGGTMDQIRSEGALIQFRDPRLSTGGHTLGSDKGSMTLKELTDLCTTLSHKVLDLEKDKIAQAKEIASLKKRVTKLEQRQS
nr:hypothetical protein [Tanacetum cinerariifolium]